jgi:hypothetical protein
VKNAIGTIKPKQGSGRRKNKIKEWEQPLDQR